MSLRLNLYAFLLEKGITHGAMILYVLPKLRQLLSCGSCSSHCVKEGVRSEAVLVSDRIPYLDQRVNSLRLPCTVIHALCLVRHYERETSIRREACAKLGSGLRLMMTGDRNKTALAGTRGAFSCSIVNASESPPFTMGYHWLIPSSYCQWIEKWCRWYGFMGSFLSWVKCSLSSIFRRRSRRGLFCPSNAILYIVVSDIPVTGSNFFKMVLFRVSTLAAKDL
jgi:hypothetical protein